MPAWSTWPLPSFCRSPPQRSAPGAELSPYARIFLLDVYVAFNENWERDQRSRTYTRSAGELTLHEARNTPAGSEW